MCLEIRVPQRHPSGSEIDAVSSSRRSSNLLRSRSTQSLRHTVHEGASQNEDRLTTLVQMFWISVSMLGSDYEYEFLLAVRLLDKVNGAWHLLWSIVRVLSRNTKSFFLENPESYLENCYVIKMFCLN